MTPDLPNIEVLRDIQDESLSGLASSYGHDLTTSSERNKIIPKFSAYEQAAEAMLTLLENLGADRVRALMEGDSVPVPQTALNWLNGSGQDATGQWFHESYAADHGFTGQYEKKYWWRSHFRKLIEKDNQP